MGLPKLQVSVVEEEKSEVDQVLKSLDIMKRPCFGDRYKDEDKNEDGLGTPTKLDQRIPIVVSQCPPAPRKPKSLPVMTRRSKAARRRILIDVSKEVELLFPPAVLANFGGKVNKARKVNGTN